MNSTLTFTTAFRFHRSPFPLCKGIRPIYSNPFHVVQQQLISSTSSSTPPSSAPKEKEILRSSTVPTSKFGRLLQYGGLAARMSLGAVTESIKRMAGSSQPMIEGASPFLNPSNVQEVVSTLRTMRGAALKLGQMLSIQDSGLLPPHIESIFSQLQNCADFMPRRQMNKVMTTELGPDWLRRFGSFEFTPFAAASIGQVHRATLLDGTPVAVKIQYPGIADSIASDLAHVSALVLVSGWLPRGLYLENTIRVAERELRWETDYLREARFQRKCVPAIDGVRVPRVIDSLTTARVLTMEYMPGTPLGQVAERDRDTRNAVATQLMRLCLHELFTMGTMQTDPNWSNFLYDPDPPTLVLLDFGSARTFPQPFLLHYADILEAAAEGDRAGVLRGSEAIGFLTGYEPPLMREAHIDAVMTLGEPFRHSIYDFGQGQELAGNVRRLIPILLEHRLTPPPDASYSLHRKMSGVFLLCTRLRAHVPCRDLLLSAIQRFRKEGLVRSRDDDEDKDSYTGEPTPSQLKGASVSMRD